VAAAEVCQILLKSTVLSLRQPAKVHYLFVSFLPVQGEDIFPIPGTKRLNYLEENVAAFNIKLTAEDKQQLEAVFAADQVTSCMLQHIRHTPPVVKCHSWIFCAVVSKMQRRDPESSANSIKEDMRQAVCLTRCCFCAVHVHSSPTFCAVCVCSCSSTVGCMLSHASSIFEHVQSKEWLVGFWLIRI